MSIKQFLIIYFNLLLCTVCTSTNEDKMFQWMHKEHAISQSQLNITINEFPIENDPTGGIRRGLKTKINLTRGDQILTIPRNMFMSRATARTSTIGEVFQALEDVLGDKWLLAVHLLYEWLDPNSKWRSYLDTIPPPDPSKTTNVLFWNEEDLASLQCARDLQCHVVDRIRREQRATHTMFNEIQPLMQSYFPKKSFTYERFAWAYGTVKARCFTINVTKTYGTNFLKDDKTLKEGLMSILVPLGDLFNHHNSKPPLQHGAYEFDDEKDALIVRADQSYTKGDEVFISYGILTNPDLLVSYGFILLDNPFETVGFRLSMHGSNGKTSGGDEYPLPLNAMTKIRRDMYERRGLWTKEDDSKGEKVLETHIGLDGRTSPTFMEALRVRELRWCDLIKCASTSPLHPPLSTSRTSPGSSTSGFPPPPPPPLRRSSTSESKLDLEKDLKKAVTDAMRGIFPDDGSATDTADTNASEEPIPTTTTTKATEKEKKDVIIAETFASSLDVSKPWKGKHEADVHDVLLRGAEVLLREYPTSLVSDLHLLGKISTGELGEWMTNNNTKESEINSETKSSVTMTPRRYQALLMRIETKRILHSIVLECLHGIRKAHAMAFVARIGTLKAELLLPNDADLRTKEMETRRTNIHEKMEKHYEKENTKWMKMWIQWRKSIHLVWGDSKENEDPTLRDARDAEVELLLKQNAQKIVKDLEQQKIVEKDEE